VLAAAFFDQSLALGSGAGARRFIVSNEAAAFVGSIPQHYEQGLGPLIFIDYAADIAQRVAAGNPARVLETAAGTGIVTRKLRDALPAAARLMATDLNPPMLELARAKFGAGEQVEFQPADAVALPFADGSFDAVVCQFGVMFFPDKGKSYSEVHRVLAAGGHYFFSVWDSHRYNPFGRIAHQVAGSFFPADPPQFYSVPFSCHQIDPIKESLIEAGFTGINANVVSLDKEVPDAASFARAAIYGNPLIDQVRTRGGVDPERVVDALVREFRREFGADPGRMPLQAIVFSATKRS
jgi:ubiquinone/menaquinone biosynthesis C-methylase UbiE